MIVTFTQASIAKAAPPVDGKPYEIHYDSEHAFLRSRCGNLTFRRAL